MKQALGVWPRHEVAPLHLDLAVAGRNRSEHVSQAPGQRPPEFVSIIMDDPVGRVTREGESGHPRHACALVVATVLLAQHCDDVRLLVGAQQIDSAVGGTVIGHDHEVDSLREVIVQVGLDHLGLVADEQRHHQPHLRVGSCVRLGPVRSRGARPRRARAAGVSVSVGSHRLEPDAIDRLTASKPQNTTCRA